MVFSYHIVPSGGHIGQSLGVSHLYAADIEAAKQYVQSASVQGIEPKPGLEVILLDGKGMEIWRGPYLGSGTVR
jgi:hypothetical protein